jgi:hypothetical protein
VVGLNKSIIEEHKDILKAEDTFRYQMLSRLKQDCEYYLNYGNRAKKHLWAGDEAEQILMMKELWKSFKEDGKPEWLTWEEVLAYEKGLIGGQASELKEAAETEKETDEVLVILSDIAENNKEVNEIISRYKENGQIITDSISLFDTINRSFEESLEEKFITDCSGGVFTIKFSE